MKRITITLVRHGETNFNKLKKIQGSSDIELSENGIQQAEKYKINKDNIYDVAIHSPLIRSKQTLELICEKLVNKPKFIESNLITERGYGIFEGLTEEEIKISFSDIYEKWKSNENTEISNAETIDNVVVRIKNFINFLINTNYKNVIAVTHSGFLFTLYKFINDIDLGTRPTEIYFNNYSNNILQVTYDNKEIILLLIANNGIKYKKKFDKF